MNFEKRVGMNRWFGLSMLFGVIALCGWLKPIVPADWQFLFGVGYGVLIVVIVEVGIVDQPWVRG